MRDFCREVSDRQAQVASYRQTATVQQAAAERGYNDFVRNITAFNEGHTRIEDASYLEDEARTALLGLLTSLGDAGVEPDRVYRGTTYSPLVIVRNRKIHGEGWLVMRGYNSFRMRNSISSMLVTPDGLMMPQHSPKGGFDSSSSIITIPQSTIFTDPAAHYRNLFDPGIIANSVIQILAERNVDWVDP